MTPRTHRHLIVAFVAYVAALLSIPSPARAEDIDIFMKNPLISTQRPNVLIILDTSANWAATDTVAANGTKMYENVRSELAKTIGDLTPNLFRVGLMIYAETGTGNDSIDGGVVRLGVRDLDTGNQTDMVNFFRTIDANYDKTNNTSMGLAFYEAYLYYSGTRPYAGIGKVKRDFRETKGDPGVSPPYDHAVGITGNQQNNNSTLVESLALWRKAGNALSDSSSSAFYNTPISDGCQKNFIIYIANGTVTDPNSANVLATTKLAEPPVSGSTTTIDIKSPDDENENNITDEWARFLANTGVQAHPSDPTNFPTNQKVITYTVEVNAQTDTQGRRNTKLLKSIGSAGLGGYYGVCTDPNSVNCTSTEKQSLSDAMNSIFNQIIDRNSVFAAATLPASSNVRGTFLNQVYMGVFRPDPGASPRWPGNVKHYKLAEDEATGAQFLADKFGKSIADSFAEEGFIRPDRTSIWTVDQTPGFWDPDYYPDTKSASNTTASDAPDGAFVEKGGAAQHLRMAYATDVTTRKLFTCVACADGTTLSGATYPSANAFVTSNTAISSALLGITGQKTVSSLARVAGTVTATSSNHGFSNGQSVQIAGATQTDYNVTRNISVVDLDTFTYLIDEQPLTPAATAAGQTLTASAGGLSQTVATGGLTRTGTTATVITNLPHGFTTGQSVIIGGATYNAYNGTFTITAPGGPTSNLFTYTVPTTPVTPPVSLTSATATANGVTRNISTLVRTTTEPGTLVTVTTSANIATGGQPSGTVVIANVDPIDYNGTYTYTRLSNTSFTYTLASSGPPISDPSTTILASPAATFTIASITRSAGDASGFATVTVTTNAAHTFNNGDTITISGAAQSQYNGGFVIANSNQAGRTFTYTISTAPASPATPNPTITATGGGGVDRDSLINWVRGTNLQDDNPIQEATRVRGYLHGDVLHSRPVVINYNRLNQDLNRDIAVFYGANDGIIHAVKGGSDDTDGYELWGFIPTEFYDRLTRLYSENPKIATITPRTYFADGPITANTVYNDDATDPKIQRLDGAGASKAQIYIGMRRGGRFYYSLGVTDPTVPVFKWKIANTTSGFAELGQTWSEARAATINVKFPVSASAASRRVLVFGAGYDAAANDPDTQGTATMGRGIFVVDADTGALIWSASPDVVAPTGDSVHKRVTGMTFAIPSTLAVIDSDSDVGGFADRIYAPDSGGNIWRVNIGDTNPANWTVRKVAALSGAAAEQKRKFLSAPSIVQFDDNWDSILIGSGDREHPFDSTIKNRFYMIKDTHALNDDASLAEVTDSSDSDVTNTDLSNKTSTLVDLTANVLQDPSNTDFQITKDTLAAARGWKIRMTRAGEKVVTSATTLAGTTFFGTSTLPEAPAPGQCSAGLGKAYVYAVSFKDATATVDLNGDGVISSADVSTAVGLGFPANPTAVVDEQGRESVIVPPGVFKPSATEVGTRYRVFWNLSIDN